MRSAKYVGRSIIFIVKETVSVVNEIPIIYGNKKQKPK